MNSDVKQKINSKSASVAIWNIKKSLYANYALHSKKTPHQEIKKIVLMSSNSYTQLYAHSSAANFVLEDWTVALAL